MTVELKNGKFIVDENDKVIFNLTNCTVLDYSENTLSVKSKSLEKLCPIVLKTEKAHNLGNKTMQLTENGIVMDMLFTNVICLKDIIDKRYRYGIEIRLHSIKDNRLCFKILKISDRKHFEIDIPAPDHFDVVEIRGNLIGKVSKFKEKLRTICLQRMQNMNLQELIDVEDNLQDFIKNNI